MDISLLSKMIGELILKHDQVGLPGIGTFVAEMVPASFSDRGYTINPPYRRLNFYPAKLEEDVLAEFYAQTNGVDIEDARAALTAFLGELKVVLLDRRTIVFPGLGRLRATKENNFFFVPEESLDIFPEGYGLPPISLKTHIETPEEVAISISNLAELIEPTTPADILPEPAPEPEPQPAPAPEPQPAPKPEPGPVLEPQKPKFKWWIIPLILLITAFVALCAFMVLASVAPDFIDSILYTPEELEIINW